MSRLPALALAVVAAAFPAYAQTATEAPTARVSGSVVDAGTGAPLAHASVQFMFAANPDLPPLIAVTAPDGTFDLDGFQAGRYIVRVNKTGYFQPEPMSLTIGAGERRNGYKIELPRTAVIAGRVTSDTGEPMSGAQVQALNRSGRTFGTVVTDDRGEYRIFHMPPGEYLVKVTPQNHLPPGAITQGVVSYAAAYHPGVETMQAALPVTVAAGEERAGVDIRLQSFAGLRVSGTVLSRASRQAQADATVSLTRVDEAGDPIWREQTRSAVGAGAFEFANLRPGVYVIEAQYRIPAAMFFARGDLVLTDDDVEGVELTLLPEVGFPLRLEVPLQDEADLDLSKVQLMLQTRLGGIHFVTRPFGDQRTYLTKNTPPDEYEISALGLPEDAYIASIRQGDRDAMRERAVNGVTFTEPVEVVIRADGARLTGIVRDADGNPLANAVVVLIPADRAARNWYQRQQSDQDGAFQFTGIAPGRYDVLAIEALDPEREHDDEFLRQHQRDFQHIDLDSRDQQSLELDALMLPKG